jgi:hypothetical protein
VRGAQQQQAAKKRERTPGLGPGTLGGGGEGAAHALDPTGILPAPQASQVRCRRARWDNRPATDARATPAARSTPADPHVNHESPSRLAHLVGFAIVAAAWAFCATRALDLPGVYMDAVNPDYLVVRVFTWTHEPMAAWVLPGNYLLGSRFPILVSIYHGTQHFWLGLPLYALLGTTVESLRIVHALFALGVLASLYALLASAGVRPWLATLATGALAVDPVFLFAFRTQSYITMSPAAWLLLALFFLLRAERGRAAPRATLASGFFAGLAVQGYFVYAFYVPTLIAGVWLWSRARAGSGQAWRNVVRWCLGLALGVAGYLLGYALIAREEGGLGALVAFVADQQRTLGAFASPMTLAERVRFVEDMVVGVFGNGWHHSLVFAEWGYHLPGTPARMLLLLGAPLVLLVIAESQRAATPLQRLVVALAPSFCLIALVFGGRLGGHHFVSLLPLGYAALALGAAGLGTASARIRLSVQLATTAAFALLVALNVEGHRQEMSKLVATRGAGLYSDAVNRLATDLLAQKPRPFVFFTDWGLALPFAFLTRAAVPSTSDGTPALGRRLLCEGRDVAIALIDGDRARRRDEWQAELAWDAPVVRPYRQADGVAVFELVTFKGRVDGPSCADGDAVGTTTR